MSGALEGLKILVPESRERALLTRMLEAEGATVICCPLVRILEVVDFSPVDAWLGRLVAGAFEELVLFTGEGVHHLAQRAEALGLRADFVAALARTPTLVRGPKPARALRELGLRITRAAPKPTSEGLLEVLSGDAISERRIGIQLYPGPGADAFVATLRTMGAHVDPVTPYRYASQSETDAVAHVIKGLAAGEFNMVVFTSSPQVARLRDVAHERGIEPMLAAGLRRARVAVIGPLVEESLKMFGLAGIIVPAGVFHLKPLVRAIVAAVPVVHAR
jgi:uroporphyrinogen-III synthase